MNNFSSPNEFDKERMICNVMDNYQKHCEVLQSVSPELLGLPLADFSDDDSVDSRHPKFMDIKCETSFDDPNVDSSHPKFMDIKRELSFEDPDQSTVSRLLIYNLLSYSYWTCTVHSGEICYRTFQVLFIFYIFQAQSENMSNQAFNMEQTNYATQSLKDTKTTVNAVKMGVKEMKKEFKNINIDQIEVSPSKNMIYFVRLCQPD